jgi:hypothetical protein
LPGGSGPDLDEPCGGELAVEGERVAEPEPEPAHDGEAGGVDVTGLVDGFGRLQAGQRAGMSIFDKVKGKAADLARDHGEKVAKGVDKAADAANRRTGGQHADKIRDGAERAKRAVDDLGNQPPDETGAR